MPDRALRRSGCAGRRAGPRRQKTPNARQGITTQQQASIRRRGSQRQKTPNARQGITTRYIRRTTPGYRSQKTPNARQGITTDHNSQR